MRFLFFLLVFALSLSAKTIGIFTIKALPQPWDPESVRTGITGSEEAVIYLSQQLAKLGHQVFVTVPRVPENSPHSLPSANPRFLSNWNELPGKLDVGISWRDPKGAAIVRERAHKVYFWPHDACMSHCSSQEIRGFDGVLWLSKSQRAQWSSWDPEWGDFTQIFGNGINPEHFEEIQERENPYSCMYISSYDRGLQALLNIWPVVKSHYPRATLDIYYGRQLLADPEVVGKIDAQLTELRFLDVREHGQVGHAELNRALEKTSFWTYPCTMAGIETFCISALRAQCAGAIPVVIGESALQETVQSGYKCSSQREYLATLLQAMSRAETISLAERKAARAFVVQTHTWEAIARQWDEFFNE